MHDLLHGGVVLCALAAAGLRACVSRSLRASRAVSAMGGPSHLIFIRTVPHLQGPHGASGAEASTSTDQVNKIERSFKRG